jgi:phage tail-like protein
MAESRADVASRYPLPAYSFQVTVDSQTTSFSEVSGLAVEYETVSYRHGLSFREGEAILRWRSTKSSQITLKKGVVAGKGVLYDWLAGKGTAAKAMEIGLCDEKGVPVYRWRIARAIPVKLQAPTFAADSNDVAIETLELMATGISVVPR